MRDYFRIYEMPLSGGDSSGGGSSGPVKVGDVKIVTENTLDEGSKTINRHLTETYDKATYPDLWNVMKETNLYDTFEFPADIDGDKAPMSNIAYNGADLGAQTNGYGYLVFPYNGKYIRVLDFPSVSSGGSDGTSIQVSLDVEFNTYDEYIITEASCGFPLSSMFDFHYRLTLIPEVNKIIFNISDSLFVFDIADLSDWNNYNLAAYGGLEQAPTKITLGTDYEFKGISYDRDPSDVNCLVAVNLYKTDSDYATNKTSSRIYIHTLNDFNNIIASGTFHSYDAIVTAAGERVSAQFETDYRSVYAYPVISNGKIIVHAAETDLVKSMDYDTLGNVTTELDFSSNPYDQFDNDRLWLSSLAGNLYVKYFNDSMRTKKITDISWTNCNINPNITNEDVEPLIGIPDLNFIMVKLLTRTGMDQNVHYYSSFDNGVNWDVSFKQADNDPSQSFAVNTGPTNLRPAAEWGSGINIPVEFVLRMSSNVFSDSSFGYITNHALKMVNVPAGDKDTWRVNPVYINNQLKANIKK